MPSDGDVRTPSVQIGRKIATAHSIRVEGEGAREDDGSQVAARARERSGDRGEWKVQHADPVSRVLGESPSLSVGDLEGGSRKGRIGQGKPDKTPHVKRVPSGDDGEAVEAALDHAERASNSFRARIRRTRALCQYLEEDTLMQSHHVPASPRTSQGHAEVVKLGGVEDERRAESMGAVTRECTLVAKDLDLELRALTRVMNELWGRQEELQRREREVAEAEERVRLAEDQEIEGKMEARMQAEKAMMRNAALARQRARLSAVKAAGTALAFCRFRKACRAKRRKEVLLRSALQRRSFWMLASSVGAWVQRVDDAGFGNESDDMALLGL